MIKRWAKQASLFGLALVCFLIVGAWLAVGVQASGFVFDTADELPDAEVVIVPGSRVNADGTPGAVLRGRLDAALALHESGQAKQILVSGKGDVPAIDEPKAMAEYLIAAGVPKADIQTDPGGFSTLDTCLRAVGKFGISKATVVTQGRHASRTAALCRGAKVEVGVLSLPSPEEGVPLRVNAIARERLASVKAWADLIRDPS